MAKFILILGQAPQISLAESKQILGTPDIIGDNFAIFTTKTEAKELIERLGGTIKVAEFLTELTDLTELDSKYWQKILAASTQEKQKIKFGFSLYNDSEKTYQKIKKIALEVKKNYKAQGYSSRLVSAKDKVLSSVIVAKNKLLGKELIIIKHQDKYILGRTLAVQDFASYGLRDIQRPYRDDKSGMLPPKLAKMMINISGKNQGRILDPFCGSGTVLAEALLIGYQEIHGSDSSKKAVRQSRENLNWLKDTYQLEAKVNIERQDIKNLSQNFAKESFDLIVSEPFMGDARTVSYNWQEKFFNQLKNELQNLYLNAFKEFKKIIKKDGRIVFVFPVFSLKNKEIFTLNQALISQLGFAYLLDKELVYSRPGQKVRRQITLWRPD